MDWHVRAATSTCLLPTAADRCPPQGKLRTWWLLPDSDPQPGTVRTDGPLGGDHDHASNGNGNGFLRHRASSNLATGDAEAPSQKSLVIAPPTPRWPFLYGSRRTSNRNDMGSGTDGRQTGGSVRGGQSFSGASDLPPLGRSKTKASVDLRLFQAGQGRGQS